MSHKSNSIYTCDKCEAVEESVPGKMPRGWQTCKIEFTYWCSESFDLCYDCNAKNRSWNDQRLQARSVMDWFFDKFGRGSDEKD